MNLPNVDLAATDRWDEPVVANQEEHATPGDEENRANSRINLLLETVSLLLLFGFLAVVVVMSVALFTVVGVELTEGGREELSSLESIVFQPVSYLLIFTMFSIPAVIAILAGFGIRRFLVRPEPLPEVRAVTGDGRGGTLT